MGKILGAFNQAIHEASITLIDNQITTKSSEAVTSVIKSSFEVVEKLLNIVKDVTQQKTDQNGNGDS